MTALVPAAPHELRPSDVGRPEPGNAAPPADATGGTNASGRRALLVLAGGAVLVVAVAVVHVGLGRADIGIGDVLDALFGRARPEVLDVVRGSRLPRLSAGVLVGAGLGVCGVLFQAATRNPVAEPATLGVNAGAFLAVVVTTVLGLDLEGAPRGAVAVLGGLVAAAVVVGLGGRGGGPARLALVGISVTLALTSVAGALLILFEQQAGGLFVWGSGTLIQSGYERVRTALPFVAVGLAGAGLLARRLDLLGLGDDLSATLGGRPQRTRLLAAGFGVLLAGGAVAVVGPIGFVGLAAPHVVRSLGVVRHRWLLPAVAVWGAAFVLVADCGAQLLRSGATGLELPVGVVTALLGAPVLVLAVRGIDEAAARPATIDVGAGARSADRVRRRPLVPLVVGGVVALVVVGVGALAVGGLELAPGDVVAALFGGGSRIAERIVFGQRLPRVLIAALVGAALATSGAVLQAVTRNPLADPALLGVTSGAGLGALALALLVPSAPVALLPLAALAGGLAAMAIVLAASWRGGLSPERLVLVGVALAAFATAATDAVVARSGLRVAEALVWLAGTTYGRDQTDVRSLLPWVAVLVPVVWCAGRSLDLLALGEDLPRTLGLSLGRARVALVVVACLLAAAAVAFAGPIGFAGLLGPHFVRGLAGPSHRRLVPLAALAGAALVVVADAIGRSLLGPAEVPAGLVTSLLGLPVLVVILRRTTSTS